jgi:single-strand DNA-binding protein
MGQEKGEKLMSYLNAVTIVGFVGADPEQRQARNNNGSKFTVLSVATQRSWKNTDDEWASKTEWHRVCVFRPRLADYVATTIKKGSHVLVEGSLASTTYERENGKGKKAKTNKQTFWCIRAVSSANSIAANPNRKPLLPVPPPRVKRSTCPIRLRSSCSSLKRASD